MLKSHRLGVLPDQGLFQAAGLKQHKGTRSAAKAVPSAQSQAKEQITKSMMPKTAVNFYNMKKGLYLGNKAEAQYLADAMSTQAMSGF